MRPKFVYSIFAFFALFILFILFITPMVKAIDPNDLTCQEFLDSKKAEMLASIDSNLAGQGSKPWNTLHWTWSCEDTKCEDTHSACVQASWDIYRTTRDDVTEPVAAVTQEVARFECDRAEINCCAAYESTLCKSEEPEIDLCEGKQVNCPINCQDSTYMKDGECNKSTGKCSYAYIEPCEWGCDYSNGECAQEPSNPCSLIPCNDRCTPPTNKNTSNFEISSTHGSCNPNTKECIYSNESCSYKCNSKELKSWCAEDCDNGYDDDGDGQVDCADLDCVNSLYCGCQLIGSNVPQPGKKTMVVLVASTNHQENNALYNYLERDKDTQTTGQQILAALKLTPPFDTLNFQVYATRMRSAGYQLEISKTYDFSYDDVAAKCLDKAKVKGDFVFIVDEQEVQYDSSSKLGSMRVQLMKKRFADSALKGIIVHEFAHGFGKLWDEYNTNIVDMGKGIFSVGRNCAKYPSVEGCRDYFKQFNVSYDCVQGCTSGLWYRSSEANVMYRPDENDQFNAVSKVILKEEINRFMGIPVKPRVLEVSSIPVPTQLLVDNTIPPGGYLPESMK